MLAKDYQRLHYPTHDAPCSHLAVKVAFPRSPKTFAVHPRDVARA